MKLVIAYIQPFMAEKVTDALREAGVHGVTVLDCRGFGRKSDGQSPHYLDAEAEVGFAPKVKLEIVCRDGEVQNILEAIGRSAHTGRHGDGKVFVGEIQQAVSLRSGESGEDVV